MVPKPERGFPKSEFEMRTARAQALMREREIDAVLLSTEPEVRYFTGFHTQFWESPTRPWFTVVPLDGAPIAVIPEIGIAGMKDTWVEDIRTWPAPRPGDDGVSLVADVLKRLPSRFGCIGVPMGHESFIRMPAGDFNALCDLLRPLEIADAGFLIHQLRWVKSQAEIDKIHYACDLTSAAFEALPATLVLGESERENCQRFRIDLLERGADNSPYLICGSGAGGYGDIIMGPTDRILEAGDVMIIDTGTVFDGYFCDFDRNFAFGHVADETRRAHDLVWRATEAGLEAARPGATMAGLFAAMAAVLEEGGVVGAGVGRMGHGLGMQLTEWPSIMPDDHTVLEPGTVLTLEPGIEFAPGRQMVHEEDIVITGDGAQLLTRRAPRELPVVN